jgi:2-polyprenyl-6-methoxyphenol hydroxylase-like FAD-dependent oxidoreductase
MQKYDLTKKGYSLYTDKHRFIDVKGGALSDIPRPQMSTKWDRLYFRLRANFDGLKSGFCDPPVEQEGVGKAVYWDGRTVTGFQYHDGQVAAVFEEAAHGGQSMQADLVIGADGPNSKIRQILLPGVKRQDVRYVAWRGTVPKSEISEETRAALEDLRIVCGAENSASITLVLPIIGI